MITLPNVSDFEIVQMYNTGCFIIKGILEVKSPHLSSYPLLIDLQGVKN